MFIQGWYSFFTQSLAVRPGKQQRSLITDALQPGLVENIDKPVLHRAMNKESKRLILCVMGSYVFCLASEE